MGKVKLILGLAVLALAIIAGWQIASCELANLELHEEHEIQLEPEQVTVQRTGTDEGPIIYLAADYKVRVKLLGFLFTFHFTPSSAK